MRRRRTAPRVRQHPAAQHVSTGCIRQGDQQYRVDEPMSRIRVSSQRIVFLEKQIERAGRESRRRVVSHVMLSLTASSHNIFFHASYNPGDRKRSTASGDALPLSPSRWMEIPRMSSSPERNSVFRRQSYSISLFFPPIIQLSLQISLQRGCLKTPSP